MTRCRSADPLIALHANGNMYEAKRRGSDAGNTAGLSNGHGAHALEFFAHLAGKAAYCAVLNPFGDRDAFGCLELFNRLLLLI
jgi:hypothetical protein